MWTDKKIVVYGVGGVGGYFGGRLAEKGLDVTFIARGETLKIMKLEGLKVDSIDGDFVVKPVKVTDNPHEVGIASLVIVCVKAPQVSEVAQAIIPMVDEQTIILPLQNGVDAPSILIKVHGKKNVLGGLCRLFSFKANPGHIRHVGYPPTIELGEMGEPISHRVKELKDLFTYAGINSVIHDDILDAMWIKMIFASAWMGVAAITRSPLGVIRSLPETREILVQSFTEIVNVAQKLGIKHPENLVDGMMKGIDSLPEDSTTSMQRDIMEGRPSELDFLVGAIVRIGKENNVETPVNRFIYNCLLPIELKARGDLDTFS